MDSTPERDRALANKPRHGPRFAADVGRLAQNWIRGPEGKRLRRNRLVNDALLEVLGEARRNKVEPVMISKGTLTLEVADNLLLHELRNLIHGELVSALVTAGTGIGKIRYRLARNKR